MGAGVIKVGIGGWSYAPWRGTFYPPGLPQARELEHAAARVQAIEINATFYKTQNLDSWKRWGAAAPPGFTFCVKGSRFCTNRKVLADAGEGIARFLGQGFTRLGDKLGPILWQMAATKRFERDDFARFLDLLPPSHDGVALRHAVEVRHESFADPAFAELLGARNVAVARLDPPAPTGALQTADFVYARLKGMREAEPEGYEAEALDGWAARAKEWAAEGNAFLFMINGAKVRAPAAAEALIGRLEI